MGDLLRVVQRAKDDPLRAEEHLAREGRRTRAPTHRAGGGRRRGLSGTRRARARARAPHAR